MRFSPNTALATLTVLAVTAAGCAADDSADTGDSGGDRAGLTSSSAPIGSSGSGSGSGSDGPGGGETPRVPVGPDEPAPVRGDIEVVEELPHDTGLFTQGLQVVGDRIYESTGQYGSSVIQHRPLEGGGVDSDDLVEVPLDPEHFGEGLAHTGDRVWNLTWQAGVAYDRDPDTLEERDRFDYDGEGWGLCFDGDRLIMTDGSADLTFRDPRTFEVLETRTVTSGGTPVEQLNELDCTGEDVYANVWMTDEIVRLDPDTGVVSGIYDGSHLQQPRPADPDAVLNGVAALPESDDFLVTGKLWDAVYRVQFVD